VLEYLIEHTGDVEERQAFKEQTSIMTSLISPLIKSLVELNQELQQVILETSQDFWFDTEQPLIFLDHLFRFYYNSELIEEEVFLKWKQDVEARVNCKKPKEKDVKALETVEGWFTWLKHSDEAE
jgi:translation initiation factor 4G